MNVLPIKILNPCLTIIHLFLSNYTNLTFIYVHTNSVHTPKTFYSKLFPNEDVEKKISLSDQRQQTSLNSLSLSRNIRKNVTVIFISTDFI